MVQDIITMHILPGRMKKEKREKKETEKKTLPVMRQRPKI
jgi:hypothetical protein